MSEERSIGDILQAEMNKFYINRFSSLESIIEIILEGQNDLRKLLHSTNERCKVLKKENKKIKQELQAMKITHERFSNKTNKTNDKLKESTFKVVRSMYTEHLSGQQFFKTKESKHVDISILDDTKAEKEKLPGLNKKYTSILADNKPVRITLKQGNMKI